jgi:hypothetical protein
MDVDRIHELLAYVYLTADKKLFVNPQFPLRYSGDVVEDVPDFLALDMKYKMVWLVEVTREKTLGPIRSKIAKYAARSNSIREYLARCAGLGDDWRLGAWLFLRQESLAKDKRMPPIDVPTRTTSIEETVKVWTWLDMDGYARGGTE